MKNKSFSYFALVNRERSPGVVKKIDHVVVAAGDIGFEARAILFDNNLKGVAHFCRALIQCNSNIVMIRYSDLVSPVLFLLLIRLRISGKKAIIDIPTPRCVALNEVDLTGANVVIRLLRKSLIYCTGPWVLYPAHRIVQYATESAWFELGLKHKTIKIGNGIKIDSSLPLIKSDRTSNDLKLIGVAQLANWHGYDRMIRALSKLNEKSLPCKITFTIVGDGNERPFLEALVTELGLHEQVFFTGMLTGDALNKVFSDKHVGVASLGLFRIGLFEASVLKTREYIARGLPVIAAGEDPDFDENSRYRYSITNNDDECSLVELLEILCNAKLPEPVMVRRYAEENLSLKAKLVKILGKV